jgi:uncharacterized protein
MTVPVEILGLFLDEATGSSMVLLGERSAVTHVVPIFIGPAEAESIAIGLQGLVLPRPGTHDLLLNVLELMKARLDRVVVTDLVEGTFLADLVLETPAGTLTLSSRPSDGIALAVRCGGTLHIARNVLDEAAVSIEHEVDQPFDQEEVDDIVSEFRRFLETATPGDFTEPDGPGDEAPRADE